MKKKIVSAVFWMGVTTAATHAHGAGFAIFTHDATALGEANAVTAHLDNPAVVYFNPALMNNLKGTQVEAGTTFVIPNRTFYPEGGGRKVSTEDSFYTPSHVYLTHSFNDRIAVGLGVFNPFGLGSEWPDDWQGQYLATKSSITTFNFNPAVSVRLLPEVSVAAGADIIYLEAELGQSLPSAALGIPGPNFAISQKLKGDGVGLGFNVATAWQPAEWLSMGASYRSPVDVDIEGDIQLGLPIPASKARTTVALPQQLTAGIAVRPSAKAVVEAGMRWEGWSSYRQLKIDVAGTGTTTMKKEWHDAYGFNIGGRYQITPGVAVLAGFLFSTSAVPDSTFEPAIPDSATRLFTVGTEWKVDKAKIGLAYGYQMQDDRKKSNDLPAGMAVANGRYEASIHLVSVSLGYAF